MLLILTDLFSYYENTVVFFVIKSTIDLENVHTSHTHTHTFKLFVGNIKSVLKNLDFYICMIFNCIFHY